ncbi:hypothetical protein ACR75N_04890 [Parabacteroides merdae]|uniref:hypothetical protein n=1 Tax=Parabacteroides merdae TaxID=46503 RepID=UPI003DA5D557
MSNNKRKSIFDFRFRRNFLSLPRGGSLLQQLEYEWRRCERELQQYVDEYELELRLAVGNQGKIF